MLRFIGDEFIAAEESMLIRSAGQLIVTVVGSVGYMLTMSGQVNMQFYRILAAVIVNIICNYFLIPIYGINGAAIGSFIALSVSSIIGYALVKKKFNIKLFRIF